VKKWPNGADDHPLWSLNTCSKSARFRSITISAGSRDASLRHSDVALRAHWLDLRGVFTISVATRGKGQRGQLLSYLQPLTPGDATGFYRMMLRRARLCHSKSSVCPSVRPWRSGMFLTTLKIIARPHSSNWPPTAAIWSLVLRKQPQCSKYIMFTTLADRVNVDQCDDRLDCKFATLCNMLQV